MENIFAYQYLIQFKTQNGKYDNIAGEIAFDKEVSDDEAYAMFIETHNLSEESIGYWRFDKIEKFNKNLGIRCYIVTYTDASYDRTFENSQIWIPDSYFFESVMNMNMANIALLQDRMCLQLGMQIEDVKILGISPLGFNGTADIIDTETGSKIEFGSKVGNVANLLLNLIDRNSFKSIEELLEASPRKQGFSNPNKTKAIKNAVDKDLIEIKDGYLRLTDKGRESIDIMTDLELSLIETPKNKALKLSETAQGVLLIYSDRIPRTLEQIEREAVDRGLSNHMKNISRALPKLFDNKFLTIDEDKIIITTEGLGYVKTCKCSKLKPAAKKHEPLTADDLNNKGIFFRKCYKLFTAIPNNRFTKIGFIEYMKQQAAGFGKSMTDDHWSRLYANFQTEFDLP